MVVPRIFRILDSIFIVLSGTGCLKTWLSDNRMCDDVCHLGFVAAGVHQNFVCC
jgi:hypothetical protein